MLAQSLFALAVPAAPQAGDASAAPADGAFGRLVDQVTREAALDGTGPQVLPGVDQPALPAKHGGPPRPEVLPGEADLFASDDKALEPEVLPPEPETDPGVKPSPNGKLTPSDGDPRPEILPVDVGPEPTPRPEILPAEVGPDPEPRPEILPGDVGPTPETPPKSVRPEVLPPAQVAPAPSAAPPAPHAEAARASGGTSGDGLPSDVAAVPDAFAEAEPPPPASAAIPEPAPEATSAVAARAPPQASLAADAARVDPLTAAGSERAQAPAPEAPAAPAAEAPAYGLSRVAHETLADLTAQVVRRLEGKYTRFEMALTPEDLGRVDVSLEMGEDGSLTARLAFDSPAAAAEMRGRADELRRQLEQAGFQLARDALEFSQRDGSSSRHDGFERRQNRAFAAARDLADRAEAAPLINLSLSLGTARDRVDVKV